MHLLCKGMQKSSRYCWRTPQGRKLCLAYAVVEVQEPGESNAASAAVSRGNRFANSIRPLIETPQPPPRYFLDTRWQQVHNAMRVREGTVTMAYAAIALHIDEPSES